MAGARRSVREPGKSDPIDALAVARAALREPDLPVARLDGPERDLRLLVDHREDLVAERTRASRTGCAGTSTSSTLGERAAARGRWTGGTSSTRSRTGSRAIDGPSARIARDLVARIRELTVVIDALEREIGALVAAARARPCSP